LECRASAVSAFYSGLSQPVGQTRWVAAAPFQTLQAMLNEPDQPELP
jgi:hypothetical protein